MLRCRASGNAPISFHRNLKQLAVRKDAPHASGSSQTQSRSQHLEDTLAGGQMLLPPLRMPQGINRCVL